MQLFETGNIREMKFDRNLFQQTHQGEWLWVRGRKVKHPGCEEDLGGSEVGRGFNECGYMGLDPAVSGPALREACSTALLKVSMTRRRERPCPGISSLTRHFLTTSSAQAPGPTWRWRCGMGCASLQEGSAGGPGGRPKVQTRGRDCSVGTPGGPPRV